MDAEGADHPVNAEVYDGLHRAVGLRRISRYIGDLVYPHIASENLSAADAEMAADEAGSAGRS
jgi:hypothetical protein